ncbi:hypothetical protein F53441_5334 [Fusarium austroafricanum]|uniref:F-box domain-containing protein n=1 Tax=Fusarium austroafricanum TaxID=2364996 RepID=A0A8H4KK91_9HYPO|nr:hypothetical protein F53441_5334 [Fusarium austroafricanum]
MGCLTDLPDEILERISLLLSETGRRPLQNLRLVNKRFSEIIFPLLVRQWSNSQQEPPVERLALHLLRHPELRSQVRSLDFQYLRPFHEHNPALTGLRSENLALLAEAALQDVVLPSGHLMTLCEQIRQGCEDAIAVLILAWATRLSYLDITTPTFCPRFREEFMVLIFVREAVCRLNARDVEPAESLPLGEVRHVVLQHWYTEHKIDVRYATTFFQLPKIKTFTGYRLCDESSDEIIFSSLDESQAGRVPLSVVRNNYTLPSPLHKSTVEDIVFIESKVSAATLMALTSTCRKLRKLNLHLGYDLIEGDPPDRDEMAQILIRNAESLESLDLMMEPRDFIFDSHAIIPNGRPTLEEVYQKLSQITSLGISMIDLFEITSPGDYNIVLERLPKNIKYFKARCLSFINHWVSNDVFVEPYLEGFIELLEEAGPQGRFRNLKTLDLSEAFVDDSNMVDISRIKALAKSHNVKLLLDEGRGVRSRCSGVP